MPKYLIKMYYSTFFEQKIEAENQDAAWEKVVSASKDNNKELLNNLESWPDADEIEEV